MERCFAGGVASSGRLGNGGTANTDHPVYVKESSTNSSSNLSGIIQITAGGRHACALSEAVERCFVGVEIVVDRLGNGDAVTANQSYPVYVHESESSSNHLTNIVQVKVGRIP